MRVTKGNFYVIVLIGNWHSVVKSLLDRSRKRRGVFVCVSMPANHNKQKEAKAARCGKCKNCVRYGTKKECLNPKPQDQQAAAATAAAFSSPVARQRRSAGRGSLLLVVVVGGYADGASEHPNPETL